MIKFYFTYNKERTAEWLDTMSREGYALKKAVGPFFSFVPCNPGEYEYQVDYAPLPPSAGRDYKETMEDLGVDVICKFGPWVYLRKEKDGAPFELYTDRESRIDHLENVAKFFKIMAIVEFVCVAMLVFAADRLNATWPWIFVAIGLVAAIAMAIRSAQASDEITSLQDFGVISKWSIRKRTKILIGMGSLFVVIKLLLGDVAPLLSDFFLGAGLGLMGIGLIFLGAGNHARD